MSDRRWWADAVISCLAVRWASARHRLTQPGAAVPVTVALLTAWFLAAPVLGALSRLPHYAVPGLGAALGAAGGATFGGWQAVTRRTLRRQGCPAGRALLLAVASGLVSPGAFGMAVAMAPLVIGLPAGVWWLGCWVAAVVAFEACVPAAGRRSSRATRPLPVGDRSSTESFWWGVTTVVQSVWWRSAVLEAALLGGLVVAVVIFALPLRVGMGVLAVLAPALFGMTCHNAVAAHGPGMWLDLIYAPPGRWSRLGAATPSALAGALAVLACAAGAGSVATLGVGLLSLGASLGVAQMAAVLLPYRVPRVQPRRRAADDMLRAFVAQWLVLLASVAPAGVLWGLPAAGAVKLAVGAAGGVALAVLGTWCAGRAFRRHGVQLLAYLTR